MYSGIPMQAIEIEGFTARRNARGAARAWELLDELITADRSHA